MCCCVVSLDIRKVGKKPAFIGECSCFSQALMETWLYNFIEWLMIMSEFLLFWFSECAQFAYLSFFFSRSENMTWQDGLFFCQTCLNKSFDCFEVYSIKKWILAAFRSLGIFLCDVFVDLFIHSSVWTNTSADHLSSFYNNYLAYFGRKETSFVSVIRTVAPV